jgi:hypothetical protein
MSCFAYLLPLEKQFEPDADLVIAGVVSLLIALGGAYVRRKNASFKRSYHFWLFAGAGLSLIVLGFAFGSYVTPEPILDLAK